MKYPYMVVKDGIWYPAGAEVPEDAVEKVYKKTDINRMNVDDLRALAQKNGISNAEERTGKELKALLSKIIDDEGTLR